MKAVLGNSSRYWPALKSPAAAKT